MFKNYLKIALRNLFKQKSFSFINIAGLSIGIACSILIFLWVQDELSFDRFNKNANNLYRIINYNGEFENRGAGTPAPLGPALKQEMPEVVNYTRFAPVPKIVLSKEDKMFYEERLVLADSSIFNMFTFPFLKGNPKTALSSTDKMVITESMAKKYFGEEDPMGKTIIIEGGGEALISGVVKDIPKNSHIQFDFLISFQLLYEDRIFGTQWGDFNFTTYVQLERNSRVEHLNENVTEIARAHNCPQVKWGNLKFYLQPLTDVHLDAGTAPSGVEIVAPGGDTKYVYIFSLIAVFILFIACVNFMNLSTARATNRIKEIGMRKTIGANRFQLIVQFLGESFLVTVIAGLIALLLIELFLPSFNQLSGKQLNLHLLEYKMVIILGAIIIFTALVSGSYPALYLSNFSPISILKGSSFFRTKTGNRSIKISDSAGFRKVLVVLQFSLSIGLIFGTAVIYQQLQFMRNKKLGFDKENIVMLPARGNFLLKYNVIKNELTRNPNILAVTAKDWMQFRSQKNTNDFDWEGKQDNYEVMMTHVKVEYDYFDVMNVEFVEGRNFSKDFKTDATEAFILNEEAVRRTGLESPVGKSFRLYDKKGYIIGVIKDVYFGSLHQTVNPQVFHVLANMYHAWGYGAILVKINGQKPEQTLSTIESYWNKMNPTAPFEYHFLDETYDNLYKSEKRLNIIFNYFTGLAIFISCLGLFGLTLFTANKRTKEIGIRKVLGASVSNIVGLLSFQFVKWVLVANLIALPVGYYVMNLWLQNFAYRIGLSVWTCVLAGLVALLIAILTVSYQSIKAAAANPVESLRYE